MKYRIAFFLAAAALIPVIPCISFAQEHDVNSESAAEPQQSEHSAAAGILLYLPNRLFDLLDIFRLRARVGPGIGISIRATEFVDIYAGTYIAFFAGLPGPRQVATPPIPVGMESLSGFELSVLDLTVDGGLSPNYSDSELGLGLQLAVIGVDVGIDPVEIADFFTGLICIDIRQDDL